MPSVAARRRPTLFLRRPSLLVVGLLAGSLAACGGDGSGPAPAPAAPAVVSGVFYDGAVEGLDYAAGSAGAALTTAGGGYTCLVGDKVVFGIGGVLLGSADCGASITPLQLAASASIKADAVVNRLVTLQLLDDDADPDNGIRLSATVRSALNGRTLDFGLPAAAFNTALNSLLAGMPEPWKSRSVDDGRRALAIEHFEDTLASKLNAPVREAVSQSLPIGTVTASITRYQVQAADSFYIPYEGSLAGVKADFPKGFLPAYGSGLALKGRLADGTLEFYAITDRGPNGDGPKIANTGGALCYDRADKTCDAKIFPAASFAPAIGVISVGRNGAVLQSSLPIRVNASQRGNGLPAGLNGLGASGEVPLTDNLRYEPATAAAFGTRGLDTESIVVDAARNALWTSDEYGPFIVRLDPATGTVQKKYGPAVLPGSGTVAASDITPVLPAVLAKRRANRGMEGLALDVATGRLHGFLQSPLTDLSAAGAPATGTYVAPAGSGCVDSGSGRRVERYARFTRWVEFDPATETSKMYAYPISCADYQDNRTGNAKLGDMVSLGNGKFIVIEQGAGPSGKVFNKLMLVEVGAATDLSLAAFNPTTSDLEKSSMAGAPVNGANYAAVIPMRKTVLLDLNAAGWLAEKAEGLALVDATTLALVNDNDFGLRTQVFDATGAAIAGADITACTSTDGVLSGCTTGGVTGVSARVARGLDVERPNRLWLISFGRNLVDFSVPASAP